MGKFIVEPHFRLQEWVAEEKGYFKAEGLDYEFREAFKGQDLARAHATPNKVGAYQNIESGRDSNVSCACHYSTIQALEQYMPLSDIKLSFADGILFSRMEKLIDRQVPAASVFSGPYYFLEQMGFRKVIDTTFMMASMLNNDPDPEDVKKYFRALRKAQRDIDLRPELYTHYYKREFPARFVPMMDTRRWGPGERIVFEPYTKEVFEESFKWIRDRGIFEGQDMGAGK